MASPSAHGSRLASRPEPPTRRALRIGDVADRTGVTVETLRYYEQRGLLAPTGRLESGYRTYDADAVTLVQFIKRAQSLGFSLAEVEQLVRLRSRAWSGDAPRRLRDAAVAKVRDLDRQMHALRTLRSELAALLRACDTACPEPDDGSPVTDDPANCPLVDALDAGGAASDTRPRSTRAPSSPGRRSDARTSSPASQSPRSTRRRR